MDPTIASSTRSSWLLKSPPLLFSRLSSLPDGSLIGTLTFTKGSSKEGRTETKPTGTGGTGGTATATATATGGTATATAAVKANKNKNKRKAVAKAEFTMSIAQHTVGSTRHPPAEYSCSGLTSGGGGGGSGGGGSAERGSARQKIIPLLHVLGPRSSAGDALQHEVRSTVVRSGFIEPSEKERRGESYRRAVKGRLVDAVVNQRGEVKRDVDGGMKEGSTVSDEVRAREANVYGNGNGNGNGMASNNDKVIQVNEKDSKNNINDNNSNNPNTGNGNKVKLEGESKSNSNSNSNSNFPRFTGEKIKRSLMVLWEKSANNVRLLSLDLGEAELSPQQQGFFTVNELLGELARSMNMNEGGEKSLREILKAVGTINQRGKFKGRWGLRDDLN